MIRFFGFLFLLLLFIGCASTPSDTTPMDVPVTGTVLDTAPKNDITNSNFSAYFSTINNDILINIQKGSPSSIQLAMSMLRSDYANSEQSQVLLAICSTIMEHVWSSENSIEIAPSSLPSNLYTSTLESINRGIYEDLSDSDNFLSLTLPSLVMFSTPEKTDYFQSAKKALSKSLSLDSSSILTQYLMGVLLMRMNDYETALPYLLDAMTQDSGNIKIIYAYFNGLLKSGDIQGAYNFSQTLLTRYPTDTTILELSAATAFENKNYAEAESLIAQSLRFEPSNSSLILFRAKVLFELEDYFDVSSLLDVYSRTDAQDKDYLILRAKLQSTWNRNIPAAVRTIQEALTLYPNDNDVLLLAANLSSESGQRILGSSAKDLLTKILEQDSENVAALEIWIKESISQQDWEEAYEASSFIMTQEDMSLETALQHIEICIALNLLTEARNIMNTIYYSNTSDEKTQQWSIRLLIAEGRNDEAKSLIENLLPSATGSIKSILYFERSRLQTTDTQVLSDLRTSLTANPRNEYSLFGLYEYYFERKDYSKAQYYLKQVIALNPSNLDALSKNEELTNLLQ